MYVPSIKNERQTSSILDVFSSSTKDEQRIYSELFKDLGSSTSPLKGEFAEGNSRRTIQSFPAKVEFKDASSQTEFKEVSMQKTETIQVSTQTVREEDNYIYFNAFDIKLSLGKIDSTMADILLKLTRVYEVMETTVAKKDVQESINLSLNDIKKSWTEIQSAVKNNSIESLQVSNIEPILTNLETLSRDLSKNYLKTSNLQENSLKSRENLLEIMEKDLLSQRDFLSVKQVDFSKLIERLNHILTTKTHDKFDEQIALKVQRENLMNLEQKLFAEMEFNRQNIVLARTENISKAKEFEIYKVTTENHLDSKRVEIQNLQADVDRKIECHAVELEQLKNREQIFQKFIEEKQEQLNKSFDETTALRNSLETKKLEIAALEFELRQKLKPEPVPNEPSAIENVKKKATQASDEFRRIKKEFLARTAASTIRPSRDANVHNFYLKKYKGQQDSAQNVSSEVIGISEIENSFEDLAG